MCFPWLLTEDLVTPDIELMNPGGYLIEGTTRRVLPGQIIEKGRISLCFVTTIETVCPRLSLIPLIETRLDPFGAYVKLFRGISGANVSSNSNTRAGWYCEIFDFKSQYCLPADSNSSFDNFRSVVAFRFVH
eukprot:TRINITY_DN3742_c0_g1_i1.p1 TRINITY_DN3742_c0_g1~~TRINITY_DN3742_c0_g1_i1.p1  ORF type:complete len:132 (+),score=16.65 TRINITY_DN3742_c0_g1_i1:1078-1473(+)